MFNVIFFGTVAVLAAGLVIKLLVDHFKWFDTGAKWGHAGSYGRQEKRISWAEFGVGSVIVSLLVVPILALVASNVFTAQLLTFDEFWNGYETYAAVSTNGCTRNGSCRYVYDCDPYQVVKTRSVPDGNGGSRTETYTETEYHSCPYATTENTYTIKTTLGDFRIGVTLEANPQPFRGGTGIPGDIPRGVPTEWQAAADRLAAGDPGPVTVTKTYDNYILASQRTILDKYAGDIETYQAQDLLPQTSMAKGVHHRYLSSKVHFTGSVNSISLGQLPEWEFAVDRFNAALGSDLRGDLHLVFVSSDVDRDRYTGALNAYWTGETFGDQALSKNAIVVVVGVDGTKAAWSRAFTGMPVGNELMLQRLSDLDGTNLTPDELLGRPVGQIVDGKFEGVSHTDGAIENVVWSDDAPFTRICMVCDDPGENGGYGYLAGDIDLTTGQKWITGMVCFFLGSLVWVAFIFIGNHYRKEN